jgi:hypothetical protein
MIKQNNENISFLLEEKEDTNKDETKFNLDLFLDEIESSVDEEMYDMYTVKELLRICEYYGLDKNIKAAKCRKCDIISTLEFFEGQPENGIQVYNRKKMWSYMDKLAGDPMMKKYILWR